MIRSRAEYAPSFWAKVDVRGPDECWPWVFGRYSDGYGQVKDWLGRGRRAHAVALELHTGSKAGGRDCCHSCDNPPCCNPAHLFWGSKVENRADCVQKRRQARGEHHGQAKLTADQVTAIRARHKRRSKTDGTFAIARDYGVNKNTIDRIINGAGWER